MACFAFSTIQPVERDIFIGALDAQAFAWHTAFAFQDFAADTVRKIILPESSRIDFRPGSYTGTIGRWNCCGKFKIALIMSGNRHDGARSIAHEDIVGNPDRDGLAVHRIDRIGRR